MNKKKFISTGVLAVVIMIGAGVAYYCYPSAINNALGINTAGVDTISDGDLLAADGGASSSSLAAIDPDAAAAVSQTPAPVKKSVSKEKSAVAPAQAPAANGNLSGTAIVTSSSPSPLVVSSTSVASSGTPGVGNSARQVTTTLTSTVPTAIAASVQSSAPASQSIAPVENASEETSTPPDSDVATSTSVATSSTQATTTTDNGASNSNSADNNASTTTTTTVASASASNHVLIAAVQIAGATASNDLVKLYNPTAAAIDMSGWKLHKKSSTGTDYSLKAFPTGSVIGAGQSFVWANSEDGFSETVSANVSSTETLAADNSVALMDAAGTIVDAVAWGTGTSQYGEGPPYPTSPGANQLLSRRSSDGVMADTGDNSNDFALQ